MESAKIKIIIYQNKKLVHEILLTKEQAKICDGHDLREIFKRMYLKTFITPDNPFYLDFKKLIHVSLII